MYPPLMIFISYAIRVISKESRRLVPPRTSLLFFHLRLGFPSIIITISAKVRACLFLTYLSVRSQFNLGARGSVVG
jgi:hypothetical protein